MAICGSSITVSAVVTPKPSRLTASGGSSVRACVPLATRAVVVIRSSRLTLALAAASTSGAGSHSQNVAEFHH